MNPQHDFANPTGSWSGSFRAFRPSWNNAIILCCARLTGKRGFTFKAGSTTKVDEKVDVTVISWYLWHRLCFSSSLPLVGFYEQNMFHSHHGSVGGRARRRVGGEDVDWWFIFIVFHTHISLIMPKQVGLSPLHKRWNVSFKEKGRRTHLWRPVKWTALWERITLLHLSCPADDLLYQLDNKRPLNWI